MKTKCTVKSFRRGLHKLPEWITYGNGWDIGFWREPFGAVFLGIGVPMFIYTMYLTAVLFAAHPLLRVITITTLVGTAIYYIIRATITKCCELGNE